MAGDKSYWTAQLTGGAWAQREVTWQVLMDCLVPLWHCMDESSSAPVATLIS